MCLFYFHPRFSSLSSYHGEKMFFLKLLSFLPSFYPGVNYHALLPRLITIVSTMSKIWSGVEWPFRVPRRSSGEVDDNECEWESKDDKDEESSWLPHVFFSFIHSTHSILSGELKPFARLQFLPSFRFGERAKQKEGIEIEPRKRIWTRIEKRRKWQNGNPNPDTNFMKGQVSICPKISVKCIRQQREKKKWSLPQIINK